MLYNATEVIGYSLNAFTTHITGASIITGLLIVMFFIIIGFAFRLPVELVLLCCLPVVFVLWASSWITILGGLIILAIAILFIYRWIDNM
jgi:hypothetical protein